MWWPSVLLCFLLGLAYASKNPGWKSDSQYVYQVRGRSLASLHEISNAHSGIIMKSKLIVQPNSKGNLRAQILEPEYAKIHTNLSHGWETHISDSELGYEHLPVSSKPFEIVMKKGIVRDVIVNKDISNWEANIIKSIASQFQLDTKGKTTISHGVNDDPKEDSNSPVYKTMEETITGVTETLYEIHPLPEYVLQAEPWLAPYNNLAKKQQYFEIVKNRNLSHSDRTPAYHFGFNGIEDFQVSNKIGQFIAGNIFSRVVISGSLKHYTLQSSVTVDQIIISPTMVDKQKGSVNTKLNVTLISIEQGNQQIEPVSNPIAVGVVYQYNNPYADSNGPRPGHQDEGSVVNDYSQGSSELSESSSHENSNPNRLSRGGFSVAFPAHIKPNVDWRSSPFHMVSESWHQNQPRLNEAPASPLLPLTVGYDGQSLKKKQNIVNQACELSQQIVQECQQPETIRSQNTVGKFVILTNLYRIMDQDEMEKVVNGMCLRQMSNLEGALWVVNRDAVAQAGTGPAFIIIQNWIKNGKISGEEAAEVVAVAASAARQPTEAYMKAFFEMVKSNEVMSQRHLNESALLSYTTLAHQVYIHKAVSNSRYPVQSFGSFFTYRGQAFVKYQVVPYLTKQLQNAVSNGDTKRIHAYIRALGNIGSEDILEAFEDYLEGNKQVSQFQRVLMVMALDKLTRTNPTVARSVLYKIYQNPSENDQVRAAAVYLLMHANPPADMLQRMASYTNIDPSSYVNSAVKSSIESASQLKSPEYNELRSAAQSAKPLLTTRQYGLQYSHHNLSSYVAEEMELAYKEDLETWGGEDHALPKGIKYTLRKQLGGFNKQLIIAHSVVSSIEDFINVFHQQTEKYQQQQQQQQQNQEQYKWASENIAKLLNMQNEQREQLEGNVYIQMGDLQTMFSFDNQTLENLPQVIWQIEEELKNGRDFSYSKMIIDNEVTLAFPTVIGLPFLYTYDKPTFINIEGRIKANANPPLSSGQILQQPQTLNSRFEISASASGKAQSQFGFVTPFDNQRYSAGYNKDFQIVVPLTGSVQVNRKRNQIKVGIQNIGNQRKVNLLYFSTSPYTANNEAYSPNPQRQVIRKNHQKINKAFGQHSTGIALYLQAISDQEIDGPLLYRQMCRHNFMTALLNPWTNENIQHFELNFGIDGSKSSNNALTLQAGYLCGHDKSGNSESDSAADISHFDEVSDDPLQQQEQFARIGSANMSNLQVCALNAHVTFTGQNEIKYSALTAVARNGANSKKRLLIRAQRQNQRNQRMKFYLSAISNIENAHNSNSLNLNVAMSANPVYLIEVQAALGENYLKAAKMNASVKFRKSENRTQYLKAQPEYRQCQKEMKEGNHQLPACAKMTAKANLLDHFAVNITYANINKHLFNQTYKLYSILREHLYLRVEENIMDDPRSLPINNSVYIQGQFSPDLQTLNFSGRSHCCNVNFTNIKINQWVSNLLVPHPVYNAKTRLEGHVLQCSTYQPVCVADKIAATTFDNKTYPLRLSSDWSVLLQYVPRSPNNHPGHSVTEQLKQQLENYVVLVRALDESSQQKEVKIVVKTPHTQGHNVEITLKPSLSSQMPPQILINKQEIHYNQKHLDFYNGYIEIDGLPDGEANLKLRETFTVAYDGVRVKLQMLNSKFRGASRGLCGTFTGEQETDFLSSDNCILSKPEEFVASYTVWELNNQNQENNSGRCYRKQVKYVNVISSKDTQVLGMSVIPVSSSGDSCSRFQTRYIDQGNEICFTLHPLLACKQGCQEHGNVRKNVPVHCVQSTNAAKLWKNEIDKGASPDFTSKLESRKVRMNVPQSCTSN